MYRACFGSWIIERSKYSCVACLLLMLPTRHRSNVQVFHLRMTTGLQKYFSFVSICKYLLTAGLREQNINVTQLWPGIL